MLALAVGVGDADALNVAEGVKVGLADAEALLLGVGLFVSVEVQAGHAVRVKFGVWLRVLVSVDVEV